MKNLTNNQKLRLEKDLSSLAGCDISIDDSSETSVVYAFTDELSMYRISDKMREMPNFRYGFSEHLKSFYISLDLA